MDPPAHMSTSRKGNTFSTILLQVQMDAAAQEGNTFNRILDQVRSRRNRTSIYSNRARTLRKTQNQLETSTARMNKLIGDLANHAMNKKKADASTTATSAAAVAAEDDTGSLQSSQLSTGTDKATLGGGGGGTNSSVTGDAKTNQAVAEPADDDQSLAQSISTMNKLLSENQAAMAWNLDDGVPSSLTPKTQEEAKDTSNAEKVEDMNSAKKASVKTVGNILDHMRIKVVNNAGKQDGCKEQEKKVQEEEEEEATKKIGGRMKLLSKFMIEGIKKEKEDNEKQHIMEKKQEPENYEADKVNRLVEGLYQPQMKNDNRQETTAVALDLPFHVPQMTATVSQQGVTAETYTKEIGLKQQQQQQQQQEEQQEERNKSVLFNNKNPPPPPLQTKKRKIEYTYFTKVTEREETEQDDSCKIEGVKQNKDLFQTRINMWKSGSVMDRMNTADDDDDNDDDNDDDDSETDETDHHHDDESETPTVISYGSETIAAIETGEWIFRPVEGEQYTLLCCLPGEAY